MGERVSIVSATSLSMSTCISSNSTRHFSSMSRSHFSSAAFPVESVTTSPSARARFDRFAYTSGLGTWKWIAISQSRVLVSSSAGANPTHATRTWHLPACTDGVMFASPETVSDSVWTPR